MSTTPSTASDAISLDALEERIRQTVELVARLRQEKQAALAERDAALREAAQQKQRADKLAEELEALREERRQVRARIEKLLGQIDALANG
jgi:FtsZ-binding cell division protein ZapB